MEGKLQGGKVELSETNLAVVIVWTTAHQVGSADIPAVVAETVVVPLVGAVTEVHFAREARQVAGLHAVVIHFLLALFLWLRRNGRRQWRQWRRLTRDIARR